MRLTQRSTRFGLLVSVASLAGAAAFAAAPPAGTKIGNQAAATYTNAAGDTITVTSNKVETIVQQVPAVDLKVDVAEEAAPGGKVFLPHTITNTGNGDDSYTLSAVDADLTVAPSNEFDFTSINIFPDVDLDGVADSTTPISVTPTLAPGEVFGIVIEANVPSTATATQAEDITVTATSNVTGSTVNDVNTDTITISTGAITELQKSMTVDAGADGIVNAGDVVTITITYDSTGLTDASNLVITDTLDARLAHAATVVPALPNSAPTWSDSASPLDDAADGVDLTNGVGHQASYSVVGQVATFEIDNVPAGRTGSFTFKAVIAAGTLAGDIDNIATQVVNGVPAPNSNTATITVEDVYRATIADTSASVYRDEAVDGVDGSQGATVTTNLDAAAAGDDDATGDDVVTEADNVSQGASIPFQFVITNHSNIDQAMEVSYDNPTVANGGFPVGTTFQLFGADGATPVAGPLGPLPVGGTTTVTLVATLPSNVAPSAPATTEDFSAVVTVVTSDGSAPNTATANFTGAIIAAAVDLVSSTPDAGDGGLGDNPDNTGNAWDTNATDPGVSTTYPLALTNTGPTSDSYNVAVTGLPTGYVATVTLPDGTPITNTGSIPAGTLQDLVVTITPPPGAPPLTTDFTVTVTSPTSGQSDSIVGAITVNKIIDLAIEEDQTRQAAPGGIIDIPHFLKNEGNVDIVAGDLTLSGDLSSFSGTLFWDVNGDQKADAGDVVVDNIDDITNGVPAGGQVGLILRVQVPSTATIGITEDESITVGTALKSPSVTPDPLATVAEVDSDLSDNAVTDTITVTSGDLELEKRQVVDPECNGGETAYVKTNIDAKPGECIAYQITATNSGTADATNVTITDTTPAYTTYTTCAGAVCPATGTGGTTQTITTPGDTNAGQVKGVFGTLIPGEDAILSFSVKIAN